MDKKSWLITSWKDCRFEYAWFLEAVVLNLTWNPNTFRKEPGDDLGQPAYIGGDPHCLGKRKTNCLYTLFLVIKQEGWQYTSWNSKNIIIL